MSDKMIINDLKKHYIQEKGLRFGKKTTVRAVDGVSLAIAKGETLGLVGESGCGKSTLARLICGLESPDEGSITIESEAFQKRPHKAGVQMVFQDPYTSLNPRKKVKSILTDAMIHHGLCTKSQAKEEAARLLNMVGLDQDYSERFPSEFSGGQRQRIGIARALALKPEVLILDEPVSALDVLVQAQILNLLKDLKDELGLTCLFIGHGLAGVRYLSDRIAVMYMGKIVEIADANDIFIHPGHPYTRALKEAAPASDPRLRDAHFKAMTGEAVSGELPVEGCSFRNRCPYASDDCAKADMTLREIGPGHLTACIRDEIGEIQKKHAIPSDTEEVLS